MAHQWRGLLREYAERLPLEESDPVVTLLEGGTPLVEAQPFRSASERASG